MVWLVPAGGDSFKIDEDHAKGQLVGELPSRDVWVRQALIEAAAELGWEFVLEQQILQPQSGIRLSFARDE